MANILSVEELNRLLNAPGLPFFEAVAVKGEGVLTTLTRVTRVVADHLKQTLFSSSIDEPPAPRLDLLSAREKRSEPSRSLGESLNNPSESDAPAFLGKPSVGLRKTGPPELQVFSKDKHITTYSDTSSKKKNAFAQPHLTRVQASAPAAQPLEADRIPSLGDLEEPLGVAPRRQPTPTLAALERTAPQKAATPEQPAATESPPKPVASETPSGNYWVDSSLVTVSAEAVSAPEAQKGVAVRFGDPERETGNQVRIPVALRLKESNEIISFQMVIRVEQDSDST